MGTDVSTGCASRRSVKPRTARRADSRTEFSVEAAALIPVQQNWTVHTTYSELRIARRVLLRLTDVAALTCRRLGGAGHRGADQ